MPPGRESYIVSAMFTKTSVNDSEKLCDNDVLGLKESHYKHDDYVYEKFKKQLTKDKEDWYKHGTIIRTGMTCKKIPL